MNITKTKLEGVVVLNYDEKADVRGPSYHSFSKRELDQAGIAFDCVEETVYCPQKAGTLYGINFQNEPLAQAKLLFCIKGRGLDYAVDLRRSSNTYRQWTCTELSAENRNQVFLPRGFGHVFLSMQDDTQVVMRIDRYFDKACKRGIAWDDPDIAIDYPVKSPILAPHDVNAPRLSQSDCNL